MTIDTIPARRHPECEMAFHVERRPHFLLIAFKGETDFDQAEVISTQLLRIPLGAFSLVVLNLAELTFLSSLALGALVEYRRDLRRRGVEVGLANVPAQVWLTLELAGLGKLFEPIDLDEPTRRARSIHKAPARFSPRTIGFWLGGGLLGTGGCILGVCMPYHHPVALVISALWWGIYFGCFGASVGALIGCLTERALASASRRVDERSRSAQLTSLPAACLAGQEERVDCYDHKPDREDRSERMDKLAENQSLLVIGPGASKE
jgi:anti-anti-sigma factor